MLAALCLIQIIQISAYELGISTRTVEAHRALLDAIRFAVMHNSAA